MQLKKHSILVCIRRIYYRYQFTFLYLYSLFSIQLKYARTVCAKTARTDILTYYGYITTY